MLSVKAYNLAPQNMSSTNDTKPSDMLKEEGNSLFKAGKIMGAFLKYNEAHMKLSKLDRTHDIIYKRAVLLSNRSNCLFELGKYDKSSDDARQCIILLEDASSDNKELPLYEQCKSLKRKNLLQIARCGIYGEDLGNTNSTSFNKNIAEPLQYLSTCGDAAYKKRALRMMSQVRNLGEDVLEKNRLGDDLPFLPSIHHESVYGSFVQVKYY